MTQLETYFSRVILTLYPVSLDEPHLGVQREQLYIMVLLN